MFQYCTLYKVYAFSFCRVRWFLVLAACSLATAWPQWTRVASAPSTTGTSVSGRQRARLLRATAWTPCGERVSTSGSRPISCPPPPLHSSTPRRRLARRRRQGRLRVRARAPRARRSSAARWTRRSRTRICASTARSRVPSRLYLSLHLYLRTHCIYFRWSKLISPLSLTLRQHRQSSLPLHQTLAIALTATASSSRARILRRPGPDSNMPVFQHVASLRNHFALEMRAV